MADFFRKVKQIYSDCAEYIIERLLVRNFKEIYEEYIIEHETNYKRNLTQFWNDAVCHKFIHKNIETHVITSPTKSYSEKKSLILCSTSEILFLNTEKKSNISIYAILNLLRWKEI